MPVTLVAFHAHPDDESLLMGGTIARLAAQGHRVVLVSATDGAAGLASASMGAREELGRRRLAELEAAAAALGAARVVPLGFPDGGMTGVGVESVAEALSRVLAHEAPDLLTGYDPSGGYGHPDHVQVHRVARVVAAQSPGLRLLEATVDRRLIVAGARVVSRVPGAPPVDLAAMRSAYLPADEITHRLDVRGFVEAKVAGLTAHHSQQTGGGGVRTLTLLTRLPGPVRQLVLGREWFREVGCVVPRRPLDDLLRSADDAAPGR